MTECERIIKAGKIPETFLKPEYRCGYYVDERMKKIWMVSLDLYFEFERVCKKHGLKYFMLGGSLLGTIRHEGFIPWDDDIDVAMLRQDYDKFVNLSAEFAFPYFLQTPLSDKYSGFSFAKLRNSNTCAVVDKFKYCKMNQGIAIDIFPIDKVNGGTQEADFDLIIQYAVENSTYMRKDNPTLTIQDMERVKKWKGISNIEAYNQIQKICSKYKDTEQNKVALMAFNAYGYKRQTYDSGSFEKMLVRKFEGYEVPVPEGYDNILTVAYGDYMILPPSDSRKPIHSGAIFDPDVSYLNYIL